MLTRLVDFIRLRVGAEPAAVKPVAAVREPRPESAPAPGAATITLSATARFIAALVAAPPAPPPTVTVRPVPLLPGPPTDPVVVAGALKRALADSGLFYESHQAQWIAGERPLLELMREPQGRLAPLPPRDAEAPTPAPAPAPVDGPALPERKAEAPVHPVALGIVRQQLDTLADRQLTWHGPIWPGQTLDWEITEERRQPPAASGRPAWRTRLRLTLPRLGEVQATLACGAGGVGIALSAARPATVDAMTAESAELRAALTAAGLAPTLLAVAHTQARHE